MGPERRRCHVGGGGHFPRAGQISVWRHVAGQAEGMHDVLSIMYVVHAWLLSIALELAEIGIVAC